MRRSSSKATCVTEAYSTLGYLTYRPNTWTLPFWKGQSRALRPNLRSHRRFFRGRHWYSGCRSLFGGWSDCTPRRI